MKERESKSVSVMVKQRKRETNEKDMGSVMTMSGRCGETNLLDVGGETRGSNWQYRRRE